MTKSRPRHSSLQALSLTDSRVNAAPLATSPAEALQNRLLHGHAAKVGLAGSKAGPQDSRASTLPMGVYSSNVGALTANRKWAAGPPQAAHPLRKQASTQALHTTPDAGPMRAAANLTKPLQQVRRSKRIRSSAQQLAAGPSRQAESASSKPAGIQPMAAASRADAVKRPRTSVTAAARSSRAEAQAAVAQQQQPEQPVAEMSGETCGELEEEEERGLKALQELWESLGRTGKAAELGKEYIYEPGKSNL